MKNNTIPARLHWACRRGMLELDVLLGNFLNEAYAKLSQENQELFVQLLSENDQDLFTWLTGKEQPKNPDYLTMVTMIRLHAKNRH